MMWLQLRCTPRTGRADLAWLAGLTGSLDVICQFLLRTEIGTEVSTAEVSTVQIGSPLVHLRSRSGGRVIELGAQLVHSAIAVQVLALLGLLVNDGPELASWPDNVKAAWHSTGNDADQARRAYQRITEDSVIAVGTGRAKQRRREADIRELHLTATLTGCCGRPRPANLPSAFRRAPPLDS